MKPRAENAEIHSSGDRRGRRKKCKQQRVQSVTVENWMHDALHCVFAPSRNAKKKAICAEKVQHRPLPPGREAEGLIPRLGFE